VGRDDGERLDSGRFYRSLIAKAQRHGHRRQAKRLYRKAARCRADALHKFRRRASVRGNEFSHNISFVEPDLPVRAKYGWGACYAAT
jgi:hypothetical protein